MSNKPNGWMIGELKWIAHETIEPGWLRCNDQAVSREKYSQLFDRVGTRWGVGDGSTTFNLPPNGITLVNWDESQTEFDTIGFVGGSKVATMPSHNHTLSPNPHSHTYTGASTAQSGASGAAVFIVTGQPTNNTSSVTLTMGNAGGTGDNLPPYGVAVLIICYTNDL